MDAATSADRMTPGNQPCEVHELIAADRLPFKITGYRNLVENRFHHAMGRSSGPTMWPW